MVQAARGREDDIAEGDRQTNSLAGLAIVLGLITLGLYLVEALRACAPLTHLPGYG